MATGNVSLLDVAKNMQDSKEKGIIMTYALTSHPLMAMPFETVVGGVKKWKVVNDLAFSGSSSAYRNLEGEYTATKTPTQVFTSSVKIAGGRVKIDRALKDLAPQDIPIQRQGQIAAYARQVTIDIFEGTGGSAIYGVDSIINDQNIFSGQYVNAGTASTGGLLTEDILDEALAKHNVMRGSTYMYMNDAPARRIKKLSRGRGTDGYNIQYRPEEFGMFEGMYDGIPIVVLKDGKGTDMLSNTKGDGSSTTVYVVTYGDDNFTGFQAGQLEVIPMTEVSVLEAFDIEHKLNVAAQSVRCITKIQYVKNAVS